jgi:hypothetical protein
VVSWSAAQPYRNPSFIPPAQRSRFDTSAGAHAPPTDFRAIDRLFAATAKRRLNLLPVVLNTPYWATKNPGDTRTIGVPAHPADYAHFLKILIQRYGPHGRFWSLNKGKVPYRPEREWQIWNEPNHDHFWPARNWPSTYTSLLKAAHSAVKRADHGARVVLSGLAGQAWIDLARLYKAHARGYFDVAAVQVFTRRPSDIIRAGKYVRNAMKRYHDSGRSWMWTEFSWPAAYGRTRGPEANFVVTPSQQAGLIRQTYPLLARAHRSLHLARVYWYTWASGHRSRDSAFDYAGLRRSGSRDSRPTSSFSVWQRAIMSLEGCRHGAKKTSSACR